MQRNDSPDGPAAQRVPPPTATVAPPAAAPEILQPRAPSPTGEVLALQRAAGNHAVGRMLARTPAEPAAVATAAPGELSSEEQAFFNLTVEAGSRVALATGKYSAYLSSITIPWAQAWTAHTNALKSTELAAKNTDALMLGVILALLPGGIGGLVGKAMKNLGAGDAIVDGVKDLAKYGLRESGRRIVTPNATPHGGRADPAGAIPVDLPPGPGSSTGTGFSRMPTDPLVWQNEANLRAESEILTPCREYIVQWQHSVNAHDPAFDMRFDPVAAVDDALKLDDVSLFEHACEPAEPVMKKYEQGFLVDWIESELRGIALVQVFEPSRLKIMDGIETYGLSIGLEDVAARLYFAAGFDAGEERDRAKLEVPAERERLGQPPL